MKVIICIVIFSFLSIFQISAQDNFGKLDSLIEVNRNSNHVQLIDLSNLADVKEMDLVNYLGDVLKDEKFNQNIQYLSISYLNEIGIQAKEIKVKQEVVAYLIEAFQSENLLIWQTAARNLLRYKEEDYTQESKRILKKITVEDKKIGYWHILLMGVARIDDQKAINFLKEIAKGYEYGFESESWAAKLALSRLGDKNAINDCISKIEAVTDPIFKVSVMKHYGYIRQDKTTGILINYLNSDIQLPSVKGWDEGVYIKFYALEILSAIVIDFPKGKRTYDQFTKEELSDAIIWFKNNENYKLLK